MSKAKLLPLSQLRLKIHESLKQEYDECRLCVMVQHQDLTNNNNNTQEMKPYLFTLIYDRQNRGEYGIFLFDEKSNLCHAYPLNERLSFEICSFTHVADMATLDDIDFEEEPWQFEMTFAQHATNTKKHRFQTRNWRELTDILNTVNKALYKYQQASDKYEAALQQDGSVPHSKHAWVLPYIQKKDLQDTEVMFKNPMYDGKDDPSITHIIDDFVYEDEYAERQTPITPKKNNDDSFDEGSEGSVVHDEDDD